MGHASMNILSVGLHMNFRVVIPRPNCKKLLPVHISPSYQRASRRLILLDYEGTLMQQEVNTRPGAPSQELIHTLNQLCSDPKNTVFVVSGRRSCDLAIWFEACEKLGISAQFGYCTRRRRNSLWKLANSMVPFHSKRLVGDVMKHYTNATDGSYIEFQAKAVIWRYEEVDPEFGLCQAKALQDHLQNMLEDEAVYVKSGYRAVEVVPQVLSKGAAVQGLIENIMADGITPDFILCIGDDEFDRDMFEAVSSPRSNPLFPDAAEIFACTVGNRPCLAEYYLEDAADVETMLQGLTEL